MLGELHDEIEHDAIPFGKRGFTVVPPQRGGEFRVETVATQELGMALGSVEAAILR